MTITESITKFQKHLDSAKVDQNSDEEPKPRWVGIESNVANKMKVDLSKVSGPLDLPTKKSLLTES